MVPLRVGIRLLLLRFAFRSWIRCCWELDGRSNTYGVRWGLRGSGESLPAPDGWFLSADISSMTPAGADDIPFHGISKLTLHSSRKMRTASSSSSAGKRASRWMNVSSTTGTEGLFIADGMDASPSAG